MLVGVDAGGSQVQFLGGRRAANRVQ